MDDQKSPNIELETSYGTLWGNIHWPFALWHILISITAVQDTEVAKMIGQLALDWYMKGYLEQCPAPHPTLAQESFPGDFQLFRYIETAHVAGNFRLVKEQLERLNPRQFLEAIPVICRSEPSEGTWLDLIRYCITRLALPGMQLQVQHRHISLFLILKTIGLAYLSCHRVPFSDDDLSPHNRRKTSHHFEACLDTIFPQFEAHIGHLARF